MSAGTASGDLVARLTHATCLLFVPGDRPERFAKAAATPAEVVVVDLEDAVAPAAKDDARRNVAQHLRDGGSVVVRVSGSGTVWFDEDAALAAELGCPVMLAKAESADQVADLARRLGPGAAIVPLVETARGVLDAAAVCAAPGVVRPALGTVDLAAQLGIDHADRQALLATRQQLVLAAAAAGVAPPVDGVTTALTDDALLREDVVHARSLGFTGKLCLHPRQVDVVRRGFAVGEDEIAWAERVLGLQASAGTVDGQFVDKPVLDRARAVLARAGAARREGRASQVAGVSEALGHGRVFG